MDFRVQSRAVGSRITVITPHGGGIEPGTADIALAIADTDFSFYAFEGTKCRHKDCLHMTSTRFDEPTCLVLVTTADGGQIAATLENLKQCQPGSLSEASLWQLCSVNPPELFDR